MGLLQVSALLVLAVCVSADNTYLVLAPKIIRPGLLAKIQYDLRNAGGNANVVTEILQFNQIKAISSIKFTAGQKLTTALRVPPSLSPGKATIKVSVSGSITHTSSADVIVKAKTLSIFIQTDKPVYKPSQTVNFRVVVVDSNMMPYNGSCEVVIKDAEDNKIRLWQSIELASGMLTQKLELSDQPVLGDWSINATTKKGDSMVQTFAVDKYVLPKFDVSIDAPSFMVETDTKFKVTIESKYTYGKGVDGTAVVKISNPNLKFWGYDITSDKVLEPRTVELKDLALVDGKLDVTLTANQLNSISYEYSGLANGNEFTIEANVTETLTGITKSAAEVVVKVYTTVEKLEFLRSTPSTYKPGLSYTGFLKLSQIDGSVVSNPRPAKIHVGFRRTDTNGNSRHSIWGPLSTTEYWDLTVPFPQNGLAKFSLDIPTKTTLMTIDAKYDGKNSVQVAKKVEQAASGSGNYIQVSLLSSKPKAGSPAIFRISSTKPNVTVEFQIWARGSLVSSGAVSVISQTNISVPMLPRMAPSARIIAYYVLGDSSRELITDSINFNVDGAFDRNKVSISYSKQKAQPGESVDVQVTAVSGSLVGLLAVDQSVLLLAGGNDITQSGVLTELRSYDSAPESSSFSYPFSVEGADTGSILTNAGLVILTNTKFDGQYVGCYIDDGTSRDLPYSISTNTASKNPEFCVERCRDEGYNYAGLQSGYQCFCGNFYGKYGRVSDSDCSTKCRGNQKEMCGNYRKNSIYRTTVSGSPGYVGVQTPSSGRTPTLPPTLTPSNGGPTPGFGRRRRSVNAGTTLTPSMGATPSQGFTTGSQTPAAGWNRTPPTVATLTPGSGKTPSPGTNLTPGRGQTTSPGATLTPGRGPTPSPGVTLVTPADVYVGCYKDDPSRVLNGSFIDDWNNNSPYNCIYFCARKGFIYAGLQLRTQCFCGNSYDPSGKLSDDQCDSVCPGDTRKKCGGALRNSIYTTAGTRARLAGWNRTPPTGRSPTPGATHAPGSGQTPSPRATITPGSGQRPSPGATRTPGSGQSPSPGATLIPAMGQRQTTLGLNTRKPGVTPGVGNKPAPKPPTVRKSFPETWLWSNVTTTNGKVVISTTVPDAITSWVASAFAVSPQAGLGVSASTATMQVFRPFFVSLNLPYSVVRGEQLVLQAIVFNYMDRDVNVTVTLPASDEYKSIVVSASGFTRNVKQIETITIIARANQGTTVSFPIVPSIIGKMRAKVTAIAAGAADAVQRDLLVEAEGVEQEYNQAVMISLTDNSTFSQTVTIDFPPNIVSDSSRVEFSVIGDVMGPSINGLDKLVKMPYGCGEQNMLNFAPTVFVTEYLTQTNQLTSKLKAKSIGFMEAGYQRELSYQRNDGSYSAFGQSDSSGSMWLTAFVAKSFQKARAFIFVDEDGLLRAVNWMITKQNIDGSFPEPGRILHKGMMGGASSTVTLTAYVLTAISEVQLSSSTIVARLATAKSRAQKYLENRASTLSDPYSLALTSYALYKSGSSNVDITQKPLQQLAKTKDGFEYWVQPQPSAPSNSRRWQPPHKQSRAIDIELASYVVQLKVERLGAVSALPIIKWVSAQRNSNGGFSSTQDTVVALQALAKFASFTKNGINMTVNVSALGQTHKYSIETYNRLVLQSRVLDKDVKTVRIDATGEGAALAQVSATYNIEDYEQEPAFDTSATVLNEKDNSLTVRVCTRWLLSGTTGMAVKEIGIPSGFSADIEGLELKDYDGVKRIEEGDRKVIIYFDELGSVERCIDVDAVRTGLVAKARPVAVKVYDYYEPENQQTIFYSSTRLSNINICDVCGVTCEGCTAYFKRK